MAGLSNYKWNNKVKHTSENHLS